MSHSSLPTLYSFRRCPYAIRARLAIWQANIRVDLHEVSLKNKPAKMLELSEKGTVPVLCLHDKVLDESVDIMFWALEQNDPKGWLSEYSEQSLQEAQSLVYQNDMQFKSQLDRYKYASRFPEHSESFYRDACSEFLQLLEHRLSCQNYLMGGSISFADVAIFPFVRQFSMVDTQWFAQCEYVKLRQWLEGLLAWPLFKKVMEKPSK